MKILRTFFITLVCLAPAALKAAVPSCSSPRDILFNPSQLTSPIASTSNVLSVQAVVCSNVYSTNYTMSLTNVDSGQTMTNSYTQQSAPQSGYPDAVLLQTNFSTTDSTYFNNGQYLLFKINALQYFYPGTGDNRQAQVWTSSGFYPVYQNVDSGPGTVNSGDTWNLNATETIVVTAVAVAAGGAFIAAASGACSISNSSNAGYMSLSSNGDGGGGGGGDGDGISMNNLTNSGELVANQEEGTTEISGLLTEPGSSTTIESEEIVVQDSELNYDTDLIAKKNQ